MRNPAVRVGKAARRLVTTGLARADPEVWARLRSGERLRVNLGSSVGRSIWWRHSYELEVDEWLVRHLRPGDVFIDAGANVGYFSLLAARLVGLEGEVHSFEPDPRLHAMLARSVEENGHANVWCHRLALWSANDRFQLVELDDPAFRYVAKSGAAPSTPTIAVSLGRFAEAVGIKRPIRMVKVDVEGAEVEVIRGMSEVLAVDRPLLVVEAADSTLSRFGKRTEDIFAALAAHGYKAIDRDGRPFDGATEARRMLEGQFAPNVMFQPE